MASWLQRPLNRHARQSMIFSIACRSSMRQGGRPRMDPRHERVPGLFAFAAKLQRADSPMPNGAIALSLRKSYAISPLNNLARVQHALGGPAEAVANYHRALAPHGARLFANLGNALGEQGNPCRPNHCKMSRCHLPQVPCWRSRSSTMLSIGYGMPKAKLEKSSDASLLR